MAPRKRHSKLSHQQKVRWLAALCGLPGVLAALILLLAGDYSLKVYMTVLILVGSTWFWFAMRLQNAIIHPMQSASNMLSALREGDFSLKAARVSDDDALGQLMLEINLLSDVLSEHRMEAMEAHVLLDKILHEVDAAVLTFDPNRRLTLANEAALQLLNAPRDDVIGRYAAELTIDAALESPSNAIVPHPVTGQPGRFTIRRGAFRVAGEAHELVILIDVSRNLRAEELLAWKRLLRVLGHELNNSMAPIRSLSESLQKIAAEPDLNDDDRSDLTGGLEIIRQRAESLSRFMGEYASLAKLPPPKLRQMELAPMVRRILSLFSEPEVTVKEDSPDIVISADPDLLEQALLNLVKNAAEAASQTQGSVHLCWQTEGDVLVLHIEDTGPGIANPDNLFVPFFSTKKGGSGIGLTLSRQIIESHDGSLSLVNRRKTTGCRATITLPLR
jgi:two-component system nitrogen regulation sensor histidine kinase NtrY